MATAFANLGETWLSLGNTQRARDYCERTIELAREIEFPYIQAFGQLTLGKLCAAQGEHDEAELHLNEALECYRRIPAPPQIADSLLAIAQLRGWGEATRPLLEEALSVAEEAELPTQQLMAKAALAQLAGGDVAAAVAAFETHESALRVRTQMHARYLLWKASGDRAHLEEAQRLLDHLRAHAPEECRDAMIANVPLHKAVMEASART